MWTTLLREFLFDLRNQKTRVFLTVTGIVWGTMSVVLLLAFGFGLGERLKEGNLNFRDATVTLYGGETSKVWQGLPMVRAVRLTPEDADLLRTSIPLVSMISPAIGRGMAVSRGETRTTTYGEGLAPQAFYMRHFYQDKGRFLNDEDVLEKRRVVFLGDNIAKKMFGAEDPVGQMVDVDGLPYKVIGVMTPKVQMSMNNGPDADRVIMPYTTFMSVYGRRWVNSVLIRPADRMRSKELVRNVRDVLSRKYRFDPADEYAVRVYDDIQDEEIGRKIIMGLNIFFGVIGSLTLVVAGVGVANIMFIVVKQRTAEIGIKRAVGARRRHIIAQFMAESVLLTGSGGVTGILLSLLIVRLVGMVPDTGGLLQYLGHPIFSRVVALVAVAILTLIALLAGVFPARQAAAVEPIEALRYE